MDSFKCPKCGKRYTIEQATCSRCGGRVWVEDAWLAWENMTRDCNDNDLPSSSPPIDTVTIIVPRDDE